MRYFNGEIRLTFKITALVAAPTGTNIPIFFVNSVAVETTVGAIHVDIAPTLAFPPPEDAMRAGILETLRTI